MFKLENFPAIDGPVPHNIRERDGSSLVLVKTDGRIIFGRTRTDKDKLMAVLEDSDAVLFAWHGSYRTDVFALTAQQLRDNYEDKTRDPPPKSAWRWPLD